MADQITKSVRRIVKGMKDDPAGLGTAEDYKGIGTSRGEAFINARGDVTGSGSSGSGEGKDDQPTSSTPDSGNPEDNDTGGGGGVNNGSDPAGALGGDVADVDDKTVFDSPVGTVDGTVDGTLTSLNLNTLEGIEYLPPPGWDTPDLGPTPEGFTEGYWWVANSGPTSGDGAYPSASIDALIVILGSSRFSLHSGPTYIDDDTYGFELFDSDLFGGTVITGLTTERQNCLSDPNALFCSLTDEDVAVQEHPSDSECKVAYDTAAGGYKGHEKDPDCSTAQKTASVCTIIRSQSDPSKYFRYCKMTNGGTKITQVDSGGVPVPGTITKTTDEGGRVNGFYDVSLDAGIS